MPAIYSRRTCINSSSKKPFSLPEWQKPCFLSGFCQPVSPSDLIWPQRIGVSLPLHARSGVPPGQSLGLSPQESSNSVHNRGWQINKRKKEMTKEAQVQEGLWDLQELCRSEAGKGSQHSDADTAPTCGVSDRPGKVMVAETMRKMVGPSQILYLGSS